MRNSQAGGSLDIFIAQQHVYWLSKVHDAHNDEYRQLAQERAQFFFNAMSDRMTKAEGKRVSHES